MSSYFFERLRALLRRQRAHDLAIDTSTYLRHSGNYHYIYGEADPLAADARATDESGRFMSNERSRKVAAG